MHSFDCHLQVNLEVGDERMQSNIKGFYLHVYLLKTNLINEQIEIKLWRDYDHVI